MENNEHVTKYIIALIRTAYGFQLNCKLSVLPGARSSLSPKTHFFKMRTRAAARKAAEAAALSTSEAEASNQPITEHVLVIRSAAGISKGTSTATPRSTTEENSTVSAGSKRKSQAKAPSNTPVKRATKARVTEAAKKTWALPHGMGVALGSSDSTTPELSSPGPTQDLPVGSAAQVKDDDLAVHAQVKRTRASNKQRNQTQIGFRVTKALTPEKEVPTVTQEKITDDTRQAIKQEQDTSETEEPPNKVQRVTRSSKVATSTTLKKEDANGHLVKIKTERIEVEEKIVSTTTVTARKLIIFKNISISDSVVSRHTEVNRISIDTSQVLNPNKRINIKRGAENPYGLTPGSSPYPYRQVPTPEDCEEVHRILVEAHKEAATRLRASRPDVIPEASLDVAGCGEVPCVLDALLRTLISGNTQMARADAAIKNLGEHYGRRTSGTGVGSVNWEKVRLSSEQELAEVIKTAGNGPTRSKHIKAILDMVYEENVRLGNTENLLSLDHMRSLTKDEAMTKFVNFPGVAIKTAACVSLFCLQLPCFAVDTHVHKFCRWLGWTPRSADPADCYRHCDFKVPDHLKYGLHNLFIVHGQDCFKCQKITKPGTKAWNEAADCPLEHLLDRSKDQSSSELPKAMKKSKKHEENKKWAKELGDLNEDELEGSDVDMEDLVDQAADEDGEIGKDGAGAMEENAEVVDDTYEDVNMDDAETIDVSDEEDEN
ncbi:hypothetical protein QBC42DRAFT_301825 [Cladorrhinum samala]|uniref:HhH-GPD domain-containing protein n=1 Tax=Cladorrhinum samala TaxID=585594 RepID=A0AAV9H7E9_9PEZI|nr:hypothetical protein QBC42DRAFT_301825 [Cladorrhinum samala]